MINCDGLVKIYETDDKKVMALEQKYHFQWFWLSEDDWSHDNPVSSEW